MAFDVEVKTVTPLFCTDCNGSGEKIINPHWPRGDQPHSEKCSTCGGTGELP